MSLFELDNGRLVPAQFGHDVPDGFTESVWQVLYPQVLQLIERPLFSVTWRDLTPKRMVQNSRGEYEKPALHSGFSDGTNLVGRLTALDAAGQVVAVVLARQLTSSLLIESLSQLADTATLSWSDLAEEYPPGSERFRLDWADFRSAMPVQARSGPRLIFATPKISDEVRPALDVLASSGIEVHEMSMRRTSSGRIFVECNPVTPRGYNTPLVLTSGVSTDTTMQAVITMVSESASRSVAAGGAVAGEVIGETRNATHATPANANSGNFAGFGAAGGFENAEVGGASGVAGGTGATGVGGSGEVGGVAGADGTGRVAGGMDNSGEDNSAVGESADASSGVANSFDSSTQTDAEEDTRTGSLPSRRSRFFRSSRLGFRNNRSERQQVKETTVDNAANSSGNIFDNSGDNNVNAGNVSNIHGNGDTTFGNDIHGGINAGVVGVGGAPSATLRQNVNGTFAGAISSANNGTNDSANRAANGVIGDPGSANDNGSSAENNSSTAEWASSALGEGEKASRATNAEVAIQGVRLTRMQRRMQAGGAHTVQSSTQTSVPISSNDMRNSIQSGANTDATAGIHNHDVASQTDSQAATAQSGTQNLQSQLAEQNTDPVLPRLRSRSEIHKRGAFPSRRRRSDSPADTSANGVSTSSEPPAPPRLTRAQMREQAKAASTANSAQLSVTQTTRAYQIAGSGIETADIETIEPVDIRRPIQTSGGLLQNAAGLSTLAQVLQVETALSLPTGWRQTQAFLTTAGTIRLMNGQEYTDPTMALQSLGFADADGWATWHIGDFEGPTLGEALAEMNASTR